MQHLTFQHRAHMYGRIYAFSIFTRLTVEDFDELLAIVKADIPGASRYRMPIPADVRLAVTLRYLATGKCTEMNDIVTRVHITCPPCLSGPCPTAFTTHKPGTP